MRTKLIALLAFPLSFSLLSCHSPASDQGVYGSDSDNGKPSAPSVEAIHNPEFRQQVNREPVAVYKEKINDRLNKNWFFSVRLFETSKTQSYRVNMKYEELEADDTLTLPDLGVPPRPVIQKGKDEHSCMIGFMDNDHQFREYKLVSVRGDQLTIKAVKHYSVTQGYRLGSE